MSAFGASTVEGKKKEGGGVGIEEKNAVMYHTLASKGCSKIERKASELQTDGRIVSTRAKREKKRGATHAARKEFLSRWGTNVGETHRGQIQPSTASELCSSLKSSTW